MSQSVSTAFPIFNDIDGQPLEAGFIYIGTAGLPADTNQIAVYWDKDLSVPATQPIRTTGGYPIVPSTGTPGKIWVGVADYSLKVSNKNNTPVTENQNAGDDNLYKFDDPNAVSRTISDKLSDFVSVKDFGAVGDGVADDSDAIANCIASAEKIYFPYGTYRFALVSNINHDLEIDFQGSTCSPPIGAERANMFSFSSGCDRAVLRNGILDGENSSKNFLHMINFQADTCDIVLENMDLKNNLLGGLSNPTLNQDTDLLYINNANSVYINNCVFAVTSRQGISFVGAVPNIVVQNSLFEDCYLFGIDIEPNVQTSKMYETINITGCVFKNNGHKSDTNHVWPATSGNGPFRLQSSDITIDLVRSINFSSNNIISDDFINQIGGWVSPAFGIEQYNHAIVADNTFSNINWISVSSKSDPTCDIYDTMIVGNTVDTSTGDHPVQLLTSLSDRLVISGNRLAYANIGGSVSYSVTGNTFETTNAYGVRPGTSSANGTISSNSFIVGSYAIDNSLSLDTFVATGNELNGSNLTGPTTSPAISKAANSDGITKATVRYEGVKTSVSIPTGVATTVYDLDDTDQIGMICVNDYGGTRLGSFALFGNFSDGANNSSFLTNVQNSGISGSALTLVGDEIRFAHTFGSTRTVTVNVINFGQ